jgi:hypothetical protein
MKIALAKLAKLAALSECIEGVDMAKVNRFRRAIRAGKSFKPIWLYPVNAAGFHVIDDGNHRALAHLLEGKGVINADIVPDRAAMGLSWRWPRVAPLSMTLFLMRHGP